MQAVLLSGFVAGEVEVFTRMMTETLEADMVKVCVSVCVCVLYHIYMYTYLLIVLMMCACCTAACSYMDVLYKCSTTHNANTPHHR